MDCSIWTDNLNVSKRHQYHMIHHPMRFHCNKVVHFSAAFEIRVGKISKNSFLVDRAIPEALVIAIEKLISSLFGIYWKLAYQGSNRRQFYPLEVLITSGMVVELLMRRIRSSTFSATKAYPLDVQFFPFASVETGRNLAWLLKSRRRGIAYESYNAFQLLQRIHLMFWFVFGFSRAQVRSIQGVKKQIEARETSIPKLLRTKCSNFYYYYYGIFRGGIESVLSDSSFRLRLIISLFR